MKAPQRTLLVNWVVQAWNEIPDDIIKKSFKICALTTNPDGSEDELIQCVKAGEPCRGAWDILMQIRDQELVDNQMVNSFQQLEIDEDQTAQNEGLIEDSDEDISDSEENDNEESDENMESE